MSTSAPVGIPLPPMAILWDLDGTLIDQTAAIIRCYREVLKAFGYPQPDETTLRRSFGMPMAGTMALLVAEKDFTAACKYFREIFPLRMMDGLEILPGAVELLREAADLGIPQAIFTNKHGITARQIIEKLGWDPYLKACIGNGDTQWSKPEPDYTRHVLGLIDTVPDTPVLVVGDSPTDVAVGLGLRLSVLGVATGSHTCEELAAAGATAVVSDLTMLSFKPDTP